MTHPASLAALAEVAQALVRVEESRAKCPRAARLIDDVTRARQAAGAVPATANNQEALLYRVFLDGAIEQLAQDLVKQREVTEDDERYVRERLEKGGI